MTKQAGRDKGADANCVMCDQNWMSGKILITNADGTPRIINGAGDVELYDPVPMNEVDMTCGFTAAPHYGDMLGPSYFGEDSGACDTLHLCGPDSVFKGCMEALDCHMTYNMRVTHGDDPVATFMRQMIPHPQVSSARGTLASAAWNDSPGGAEISN